MREQCSQSKQNVQAKLFRGYTKKSYYNFRRCLGLPRGQDIELRDHRQRKGERRGEREPLLLEIQRNSMGHNKRKIKVAKGTKII